MRGVYINMSFLDTEGSRNSKVLESRRLSILSSSTLIINSERWKQRMRRSRGLVFSSVKRAPHNVTPPTTPLSTRHLHHLSCQNILFLLLLHCFSPFSAAKQGPRKNEWCNWWWWDENRQCFKHPICLCKTFLGSAQIRIWLAAAAAQDLCVVIWSNGRPSIYPMPF